MTVELEDTGERMIPEYHKGKNIYGAHIGRYQAGLGVVEGKVVLDIACGSGYGTQIMATRAQKVYGVDIDQDTVDYAKEHYGANNITYLRGDGTAIPLKDAAVDVVVSYETIEHIEDYSTFLKEVKRVLKPGGVLLLSTPNDAEYAEGNHFHIHEFTYGELKKLVGQYFSFHKDYFQTLWYCSTILPGNLQTSEWEKPILTTNTIALKREQSIYFFLLCSDEKITTEIEPIGVIGEHFRQRDLQAQNEMRQALRATIEKRTKHVEGLQTQVQQLTEEKKILQERITEMSNSSAWATVLFLVRRLRAAKRSARSSRKK